MNPEQNPNGQQPLPSQTPQYGVNSAPQQAPNGQYEVLPTPSVTGHPTGHNPYEFIVNPNTAPKASGFFGGNKFLQKIAIIIGGTIVGFAVLAIAVNALVPNHNSTPALTAIAQQQQEIIRVAALAGSQASQQDTKNFAATAQYSIATNQGEVLAYLAQHGTKLNAKQLALGHDATTDKTLANALATSTFDAALLSNLKVQLETYQAAVTSAYKATNSTAVKTLLQKSYASSKLLLSTSST